MARDHHDDFTTKIINGKTHMNLGREKPIGI
jgi:hypothetical protein